MFIPIIKPSRHNHAAESFLHNIHSIDDKQDVRSIPQDVGDNREDVGDIRILNLKDNDQEIENILSKLYKKVESISTQIKEE